MVRVGPCNMWTGTVLASEILGFTSLGTVLAAVLLVCTWAGILETRVSPYWTWREGLIAVVYLCWTWAERPLAEGFIATDVEYAFIKTDWLGGRGGRVEP